MKLTYNHLSLNKELQIVQADVYMEIDGDIIIDEPLCIDVGLPALILSTLEDTLPNRFASANEWEKTPFFVCGCGDPDCRGFSFVVQHINSKMIHYIEVEESEGEEHKEMDEYFIDLRQYQNIVYRIGTQFLDFIRDLDYSPYFKDTMPVIQELMMKLKKEIIDNE
ncbi:hypothetical protein [Chengkuizengella axinellae]|uniref:SMI1/KNR4 family protein n=1 Tax=Chengkuizengella axinellae TaxID=3064388 RepID=A0ABT9IUI2_9BACL|nr:hypothetical protein [Chengkuizengella sp. 2205SS18-9]MDP5272534.1 hypothetical protein [Chengkuizengella sp. 2205SS18-9]